MRRVEGVFCQVCGGELKTGAKKETLGGPWMTHRFEKLAEDAGAATFVVLTCNACGKLGPDLIVMGYTNRVRLGYDLRFH